MQPNKCLLTVHTYSCSCVGEFGISQAALSTLLFLTVCAGTGQGSSQTRGAAQTGSQAEAQGNTLM